MSLLRDALRMKLALKQYWPDHDLEAASKYARTGFTSWPERNLGILEQKDGRRREASTR